MSGCRNIVALAASTVNTIGLKADGTVVAVGGNTLGQCEVSDWRILSQLQQANNTAGSREDGTVVAAGQNAFDQCDVGS